MKESGSGFVHLHVHTEYSSHNAMYRLEELIQKAKAWNMKSLAITDKGAIHGAIRFYELAEQHGIHPIIGCEMKVGETDESLILLAISNIGYEQIVEWLNRGFHHRPTSQGDIIALSGGRNGIIHHFLTIGKTELAKQKALEYTEWFGKDNFYLEVQHHDFPEEEALIERTVQLSEKTGIPLVATHDVHYLTPEEAPLLDLLQNRKQDAQSPKIAEPFYLPSPEEMKQKFRDLPDALKNTVRIAERCQFRLEPGRSRLPKFHVPQQFSDLQQFYPSHVGNQATEQTQEQARKEEHYLQHLCQEGLRRHFDLHALRDSEKQRILHRLNRELDVILNRGLTSYFLIVWDIVQFARKRKIPVGPGRGSAAGSLVSYLLGITEVNPLAYNLSFERFLSPDRPDLPDIDLDVCQKRRSEILQYIMYKYGSNRVAHIGVVNTFGTRGGVREAGKFLNLPNTQVDLLAKLLPPFTGKGGIRHCLETLPEFQQLPIHKEPYRSLFRIAERIEGLPRNYSSHPSGIIIGDEDLTLTLPLHHTPKGDLMTSFTKEDIRVLGLLKIDLLGSRNLTVIHDTFQAIHERTGKCLEVKDIPLDDPETFRTMENGETLGCFQLESMGIRNLMRRMRPKNLEDLTALLALYRPGAWSEGIVETYLHRRSGEENIRYLIPEMEPILSRTYGLILYQEQVMQIVHEIAGYSMGEADNLRRALAKKSIDSLISHRGRFTRGTMERGHSEENASAVFDFLVQFAGYSFNQAHSVSYAYLSYWTAYLKTYYPKEYMAALLSSQGGYYDKRVYLREIVKLGIPLLGPDVNQSGIGFRAENEGIRAGIDMIKGTGQGVAAAFLHSRGNEGPFSSFGDLVTRMKFKGIKESVLKAWIRAGASDSLGNNRRQMIFSLDSPQIHLFDDNSHDTIRDFSEMEKRRMEKELLGFSLVQNPSERWEQFLKKYHIVPIESLYQMKNDSRIRVSGTIVHWRRQPTGNGDYLLSLVLQDHTEMVEVILYPKTYKSFLYQLNPEGILVEGILRVEDMNRQVVAEKIKSFGG